MKQFVQLSLTQSLPGGNVSNLLILTLSVLGILLNLDSLNMSLESTDKVAG